MNFRISGHLMGEEIEVEGKPQIEGEIQGTDKIVEVVVVRDGSIIQTWKPRTQSVRFEYEDSGFPGSSYYYLRVTQAHQDEHGNRSQAWSSPIWVKKRR